jgi:hypothetical protein
MNRYRQTVGIKLLKKLLKKLKKKLKHRPKILWKRQRKMAL